ncbi:hypothetical protein [Pseudomonas glycinae]|uniref:hypothetical protein n=1 Tax=Pseudomonas glycinae TaxID=1785145 RepID=UPI00167E5882|nr:hypothetical protein [Pseudomonas glycinae]
MSNEVINHRYTVQRCRWQIGGAAHAGAVQSSESPARNRPDRQSYMVNSVHCNSVPIVGRSDAIAGKPKRPYRRISFTKQINDFINLIDSWLASDSVDFNALTIL